MDLLNKMKERIFEMEKVAQLFDIEPFPIYFLGGSACILGQYSNRGTRDFDFVDLNYSSKLGKVFVFLRDYDILEYESTILSPKYKDRAKKLDEFKYLDIYVLSREDIIVSKIIRLAKKDVEDITLLMKNADRDLIDEIIREVLDRKDLYDTKKNAFNEKVTLFKEKFYV